LVAERDRLDAVEVDGARIFQGFSEPNTVWEMRSSRWIGHVSQSPPNAVPIRPANVKDLARRALDSE
jgi:hypothetical protein